MPEAYAAALRGDGHEVVYARSIPTLGPAARDDEIVSYAENEGMAVLSTDVKDFANRDASIAIFVAPQAMTGGDVRAAVAQVETLPFDPAATDPIWLSGI